MGQDTVTVDVPFGKGINEKLDANILPNGILATCENAMFDKLGALHKRNGFTTASNQILGGGTLSTVARLATYQGALLAIDGHFLYSYDQQNAAWVLRDQVPEAYVTAEVVAREASGTVNHPVNAELSGIRVVAWQVSIPFTGTVIVAHVTDAATGSVISETRMNTPSLVTNRQFPMLVTIGQYIWLVYGSATNILGNRLDTTAPATWGAPVTITTTYANTKPMDAAPLDSNSWLLAYYDTSAGNRVCTALVNSAGAITTSAFIAETPDNSISVMGTAGENVYVAWHHTGTGVRVAGYTTALAVSFAAVTVAGTTLADQVTLCRLTSTSAMVVWRGAETAALRCFLNMRSITNAGALLGVQQTTYTLGIVSKPFVYDSRMYVLTCNSGTTGTASVQPTYFLVDLGISDVASATKLVRVVGSAYESAAGPRVAQSLCPVANPSTGKFLIAGAIKSRASSQFADLAVQLTLDMASGLRWQSEEFGELAIFSGGVPVGFDGTTCYELGFHLYPELCTAVAAGGGGLTAGTYEVAFLYEWIDARGQRVQSVPFAIAGIGVGAGGKIHCTVPNLNLTAKSDLAGGYQRPVNIVPYCSNGIAGTTLYRDNSNVFASDPTVSVDVAFDITGVDTTAEQLYITGGVLENAALPPTTTLAVHQNRLWFVSGEDTRAIRYSKEFTVGVSPEFNEGLESRIDKGGAVTAIASMDGRLVTFKASTLFALGGQGATDTGVGDSLSAEEIHSDALGATDPRGVAKLPDGLIYQSRKGIYKLDRSLQNTYIGANVENQVNPASDTVTIVAAATTDDGRRVVMSARKASNGQSQLLVFDTLVGEWSVWLPVLTTSGGTTTAADYTDVMSANGALSIATRSGQSLVHGPIYQYDVTSFQDDAGNNFALHFVTGPLRMSGQQNRQRVRHVRLLSTFKATHTLAVNTYRDYLTTPEAHSFGAGATANGQIMFAPTVQVCEAMAIEVTDSGTGESYSIAGLQLEVSPIRGAFKLPASARI